MRRTACPAMVLIALFAAPALAAQRTADRPPTFEKDIRPILKAHCFHCHGEGEKAKGKLDLRLRRFILNGGETGPALVPGDPDRSLILARVSRGEMPPGEKIKKLSRDEIDLIGRWIKAGAKTARPEPDQIGSGLLITDEDRQFWAFQPIRRPRVPDVAHAERVRTPIDRFLLARLEEKRLTFSPEADRHALIRRASFDLRGLPPSPEEIDRFLADRSPGAYERLIDRLLASPHYGERWGRHWLDVAGYADSEGYTSDDPVRPWAWKYRDYVIRSFNADKPFDEFIREQLAGDEMVSPPYRNLGPEEVEKLTATGFLRMAPDGTGSGGIDAGAARNQTVADSVEIVSTALLGLTVGCARCHHHRYDPIPHEDYYRLRAVFEPAYDWKQWRAPRDRLISLYTDADRDEAKRIAAEAAKIDKARLKKQDEFIERVFERELAKLPAEIRETVRLARDTPAKKRTAEQKALLRKHPSVNVTAGSLYLYDRKAADELKKLAARAAKIRATRPKEEFVRALTEVPGRVPATHLFARGDHEQPKQELQPAGLTVLALNGTESKLPVDNPSLPTSGRRLAYARRLTDGTHPLVARVIVNRVWMHHFGRGIVATPGDFGQLGERPTHQELLDWLASKFMQDGWSLKYLHRLIMTSTAYRQALLRDPEQESADPENRLLWGMRPRRLEAEVIRDALLAVSGKLNRRAFGPPVPVMADLVGQIVVGIENLNAGRPGRVIPMHGEEFRRSGYVQVRRSRPLGVLETFDQPAMDPNCNVRTASTVAPQALMLMNNDFVVEQSEHFARRVRREAGDDPRRQVIRAWKLAFAREPADEELNEAAGFLAEQTTHFRENPVSVQPDGKSGSGKPPAKQTDPELQALASFCQVLIGSNEFLYVD